MDIMKLKELNEKVIDKAAANVEKALVSGKWDCECFEVLSDSISTKHKLHSIEKETTKKDMYGARDVSMKKDKTEFEEYVYKIIDQGKYDIDDIIVILSEHFEDIKILQPKFYNKVIMKMKELCK